MYFANWTQECEGNDYWIQYAPVGKYHQFDSDECRKAFVEGLNHGQDQTEYVLRGDYIVAAELGEGYFVPDSIKNTEIPTWVIDLGKNKE